MELAEHQLLGVDISRNAEQVTATDVFFLAAQETICYIYVQIKSN